MWVICFKKNFNRYLWQKSMPPLTQSEAEVNSLVYFKFPSFFSKGYIINILYFLVDCFEPNIPFKPQFGEQLTVRSLYFKSLHDITIQESEVHTPHC